MIRRPLVGVLAVQGAFTEHEAMLASVGAATRQVRTPHGLDGIDGLVLPGGESTTFGLVAERSGLLTRLREAVQEGLPVFGTCAGMIMLASGTTSGAQPLIGGMDLVVRRNAFGRQAASFEAELDVPAVGARPVTGVFIRAPWIESAGPAVEVLASVGGHGVAARQGRMLVTAFHPELTDDARLHALFVDTVRAAGTRAGEDQDHEEGGGASRVRA